MAVDPSPYRAFSRRRLLATAPGMTLAGGPLAALAARAAGADHPGDAAALAERLVGAVLEDAASARAVGRAWLLECGAAPDLEARLSAFIEARPEIAGTLAEADAPALAEALRARVREDFALGRTVMVERRQLAETEAELCALASLA